MREIFNFILGFVILFLLYFISKATLSFAHIVFPPAILGLILFTLCLQFKIIKEEWIKTASEFLLKNMALLFVPFIVGLIAYKDILMKNWFVILLVIFLTTTLTIVSIGLFVEYGLKFLRLYKMKKVKEDK